jgi:rhodanese-related sulfurtransferase
VSPAELLAQIEAGAAPTILDVRTGREFARGHVPGAINMPLSSVLFRTAEVPGDRSQPIVVYCGHGPRAWIAGAALRRAGFNQVIYLDGYMARWRKSGLRVET